MESEKTTIKELKKNLKLKKETFELIQKGDKNSLDKAKKILKNNREILSYFIKFKHPPDTRGHQQGKFILLYLGGWDVIPNAYYENEVLEDLQKLEREIEEKENRLANRIFLTKQQEFLEEQKKDIENNKQNRESMERFTFVLAFGIIISTLFNFFQILVDFKNANTRHIMLIAGIFILIFLMLIFFLFYIMKMGKQIKSFIFNKSFILPIIISIALILFFLFILYNTSDGPINNENSLEESIKNFTNVQENQTNILNSILLEQTKINTNLQERLEILEQKGAIK